MEERGQYYKIWETLAEDKSMVFLAGPRQAGKTTLARFIAAGFANSQYCNWDIPEHRSRLINDPVFLPRWCGVMLHHR